MENKTSEVADLPPNLILSVCNTCIFHFTFHLNIKIFHVLLQTTLKSIKSLICATVLNGLKHVSPLFIASLLEDKHTKARNKTYILVLERILWQIIIPHMVNGQISNSLEYKETLS